MISNQLKDEVKSSIFIIVNKKIKNHNDINNKLLRKYPSAIEQRFITQYFKCIIYLINQHLVELQKLEIEASKSQDIIYKLIDIEIESAVNCIVLNNSGEINKVREKRRNHLSEFKKQLTNSGNNNINNNNTLINLENEKEKLFDQILELFCNKDNDAAIKIIQDLTIKYRNFSSSFNKLVIIAQHPEFKNQLEIIKNFSYNNSINNKEISGILNKIKILVILNNYYQINILSAVLHKKSDISIINKLKSSHQQSKLVLLMDYNGLEVFEFTQDLFQNFSHVEKFEFYKISELDLFDIKVSHQFVFLLNLFKSKYKESLNSNNISNNSCNNNSGNASSNIDNRAVIDSDVKIDYFGLILNSVDVNIILNSIMKLLDKETKYKNQLELLHKFISKNKVVLENKYIALKTLNREYMVFKSEEIKKKVFKFKFFEEIGRSIQRDQINTLKSGESIQDIVKRTISVKFDVFQNKNKITAPKFLSGNYTESLKEFSYGGVTIEEPKIGTSTITSVLKKLFDEIYNLVKLDNINSIHSDISTSTSNTSLSSNTTKMVTNISTSNTIVSNLPSNSINSTQSLINSSDKDYFGIIFNSFGVDKILTNISKLLTNEINFKKELQTLYDIINKKATKKIYNNHISDLGKLRNSRYHKLGNCKDKIAHYKFIEKIGRIIQYNKFKELLKGSVSSQHSNELNKFHVSNEIKLINFIEGSYKQSIKDFIFEEYIVEEPAIGKSKISSLLKKLFYEINNSIVNNNGINGDKDVQSCLNSLSNLSINDNNGIINDSNNNDSGIKTHIEENNSNLDYFKLIFKSTNIEEILNNIKSLISNQSKYLKQLQSLYNIINKNEIHLKTRTKLLSVSIISFKGFSSECIKKKVENYKFIEIVGRLIQKTSLLNSFSNNKVVLDSLNAFHMKNQTQLSTFALGTFNNPLCDFLISGKIIEEPSIGTSKISSLLKDLFNEINNTINNQLNKQKNNQINNQTNNPISYKNQIYYVPNYDFNRINLHLNNIYNNNINQKLNINNNLQQIKLDINETQLKTTTHHKTVQVFNDYESQQSNIMSTKTSQPLQEEHQGNTGIFSSIKRFFNGVNTYFSSNDQPPRLEQRLALKKIHIDVMNLSDIDIIDLILKISPHQIPLLQVSSLNKLGKKFLDHQDFKESFKPLVVEEFLRQIELQFCELDDKLKVNEQDGRLSNLHKLKMNTGVSIVHLVRENKDCVKIKFKIHLQSTEDELINHDLVLFKTFLSPNSPESTMTFILGRVIESDYFNRFKKGKRVSKSKIQHVTVIFMVSDQTKDFIDQLFTYFDLDTFPNEQYIFYTKVSNTITFQREISALSAIKDHLLCDFIISPTIEKDFKLKSIQYNIPSLSDHIIENLNRSQLDAIISSLYTRGINLIQGPPGTGKTHTIYTLVKLFLSLNPDHKILICAPSHAAVDEIARRIIKEKESNQFSYDISRIGRLEQISKDVHPICVSLHQKKSLKIKQLMKSNVCFSTLSASAIELRKNYFIPDVIIVDESTQSCESSTIIPLATSYNAKKLILFGDPVQLPPTIFSKDSIDCGFNISLFERLSKVISVQMLDTQYRMHPQISNFPSKEFYYSRLLDGENVQHYDSSNRFYNDPNYGPIAFYNITDSQEEKGTKSIKNSIEIKMTFLLIKMLVQDYPELKQLSFGVITPYKLQRKSINEAKSIFNEPIDIEVNTVDGFQGGEKDIIIFSSVRNEKMGFLSDRRRINVAITRAKYALFIIGNKQLLDRDRTWGPYIKYIQSLGRIKSINTSDINKLLVITEEHDLLHPEGLITEFESDDESDEDINFETKEGLGDEHEDFDEEYQNSDSDTESDSDSESYYSSSDKEELIVEEEEPIEISDEISLEIQNEIIFLLDHNSESSKDYISTLSKLLLYFKEIKSDSILKTQMLKKIKKLRFGIKDYKKLFLNETFPKIQALSLDNINQIKSLVLKLKENKNHFIKQSSFEKLKKFLKEGFGTAELQLYGSFLSGISLEGGDLDVCFSTYQNEDKSPILQMKKYLKKSKLYEILEVRIDAKIPIIRFSEISTGIQFDMCFNHRIGIYKSNLIKEYCSIDERCRELILLVKYWALKKDINDASRSTLSSFCLVMMVIHFLQNGVNPPILPNLESPDDTKQPHLLKANVIVQEQHIKYLNPNLIKFNSKLNNSTTSQLFYSFFKYYIQFNYDEFAINISKGPNVKKELILFILSEATKSKRSRVYPIVVSDLFSSKLSSAGIKTDSFKTILSEISLMEYNLRLGIFNLDSMLDSKLSLNELFY